MTSPPQPAPNDPARSGTGSQLPFDTSVAHQARMYDYVLGGKDNYAADRVAVEAWLKVDPRTADTARSNRAFLRRLVTHLVQDAGIRQFLDIGTGIPTAGNTHEIAQAIAPETRVVYVDYDPVVLAHARALLVSTEAGTTEYLDADLRDTDEILSRAALVLDFSRPVAITLLAILHAIPDADDPYAIVAKLVSAMPSGSYLAISHMGSDLYDKEALESIGDIAEKMVRQQFRGRTRDEVARFFDGLDLIGPGLVRLGEWHPGQEPGEDHESAGWCAVARKP